MKKHIIHGGKMWPIIYKSKEVLNEIINADVNDVYYPPSQKSIKAIHDWLKTINLSPDFDCWYLKNTISKYYQINPQRIEIGSGSSDLILSIINGYIYSGDTAIILNPTYSEYENSILSKNGNIIKYDLDSKNNFKANVNNISKLVTSTTKMIILNNPNNPTGQVIHKRDLLNFLYSIDKNIIVLVDEAYIEYCPEHSLISVIESYPNLVIVRTFSKAFALAGLRIGYSVMGDHALELVSKVVRPPWPANTLSMMAAEAALEDIKYTEQKIQNLLDLKNRMTHDLSSIKNISIVPSVTNYFLVDISRTKKVAHEICTALEKELIFVRDCASFGEILKDKYIRIATQSESANNRLYNSLRNAI